MPGKHVHFFESPSPASSSSSLPSSPGPVTPPPLGFGSPYHYTALPTNGILHPVLSHTSPQPYVYDLTRHPSAMAYNAISPDTWNQPATTPPVPVMVFVCDRLPWTVTVVPMSGKGIVTIRDVFEGLYVALRKQVTAEEFQTRSIAGQSEITAAYSARCKQFFDTPVHDQELSKGVKRVDFLGKYSYFSGIASDKGGRWRLVTASRT